MKKSLYNRIQNKVLRWFFLLIPYLFFASTLAGTSSHKADYGSINPSDKAVSSFIFDVMNNTPISIIPDSSLNSFVGSSQYTINNLLNSNSHHNFISVNALAAPPTIVCPGNISSNTDPGFCRAAVSGLAATISDPDGDITTLTWTMSGATIAASPISNINNIVGSYNFNKGVTTVTYRVTDALGSTTSCSFSVTVIDNQIPSIICPNDQTLPIPACALQTDPITFSLLSVSDNCGIQNFLSDAPLQFPLGITSVKWTANDVNGNSAQCTQIVNVVNDPPMNLAITSTPVSCFGGNDGSASVVVSDGAPPYTYSWNTIPAQTTATISNLLPGIYTVTVTDFNGCISTAPVTVSQPTAALSVSIATQTNASCLGSSTGSVTVAGNGGTPAYQYSINGVLFQAGGVFSNLAAGSYTITIKDSRNCVNTLPVTITQPVTAISGSVLSQTNVACLGNATGSVTVSGNGGTPPYQFNINGGAFQASATFNSLIAGTYSIIVRDANNCTFGLSVTITQSASALTALILSKTNVTCSGGATGSATVTASGGTAPYTYSWNSVPVQTTAIANNLTARAYIVTVRDAAGCTVTANVTITQPTPIVVTITSTNVSCFGDATGTATASASGGKPPYTYAWIITPVQTTATATNLAAGPYTVAVFDSSGCSKLAFVTITQPAAKLTASITSQVNVVCAGSNTGSITVTGLGGTAPIQYNINGGAFQASGTFTNLAGGAYTIIAKDANNCTVTVPATIIAPAAILTATISSKTNVLCSGGSSGSATVTASGGTAPYTYSWNSVPVQTTATAINLTARAYIVTVRDAAGCTATANVTITQPTPIVVTITSTNVSCFGDATGTATASASGGIPPYTYAWIITPVQTTATATNLAAGTYTVAVFDSSGCSKLAFVTITQPAAKLTASITSQVNVVCAGSNTGSITVTGLGGTAPIQYNINGGAFQASGTFTNLAGGAYTIIAKDANNCTVTVPATILAPATVLTANITSHTNVLCSGGSTGSATVAASGGTAPYTYSWNSVPVQTTATANNLTARAYIVTVRDAVGCTATANFTITQPTPIVVTITRTNVSCFGDATGTATASASGGKPPYTYAWILTPVQTTANATNLAAGTYTVAVFDSSGCSKLAFVTITQPTAKLTASITNLKNVACAGNTGSLTAEASGGVSPYQYSINGGAFQANGNFSSLSAGVYTIIAMDANNCTFSIPAATIIEPANALHASITSQSNVSCVGDANGSATLTATNGTAPYTYAWNTIPVQITATANNLAVGNYIVTTTDIMGCSVIDTAFITEPALPVAISISNKVDYDCATGTNGSVTVAGAGGTPNYQYSLDGGPYQVSSTFTNLPVGNYVISVRDINNCQANTPLEIKVGGLILAANDTFSTSEDTPLNENVMTNDHVLCNLPIIVTANTAPLHGSVTVNADGTFTYIPLPEYNGSDFFTYTITDFVGSTSTATVSITIDPVNDPPVTLNDSISVFYNLSTSGNVLLNGHFDPEGTLLTATVTPVLGPTNGTFVIAADGTFTYSPNLNYIGNDKVIISLCDSGIPLPPACSNDTIFIVVLPPNQPPLTIHENIGVCQGGTFTGTLTNGGSIFNGDTDPEGNLPLTLNTIPVRDAAHGTFTITDGIAGTFNYVPNSGYSGSDYVVLSICDSGTPVECSNDTIYIEVLIPVVVDAGISQKLCNANVATLVGNIPATASSSWNFVSGPNIPTVSPSTGNVAIASGLIASPTPYVFGYSIDNGGCVSTDTMSVINYIPATPAFAGMDQEFCDAAGNLTITLAGNTPINGTGSWSQLSGPTAANILDPTNPNSNVSDLSFGIYTFQWLISNGLCQDNADAVIVTVSQSVIVDAGIDLQTCKAAPVQISGSNVLNSTSIHWTTTGNGTFDNPTKLTPIYTPGPLDLTMGTVKLFLNASAVSPCTDASDFTLLTLNKTPFANAGPDGGSLCVGNSRTINQASATDYSTLQWSVSPAAAGTLTNAETLNPTFTPAAGFSGTVVLTIQVQGLGSCTTEVFTDDMTFEVNSSLIANAGIDQPILPGTSATLSGMVSGGTGFYSWSWQPSTLLVNSLVQNPVTVALNKDTTFILTVLDITTGCTDEDSVRISMYKGAIPIVAVGDHDSTLVNSPVTINVLANDLNPDADPLILSICGYPAHGIIVINSDSTVTYTPYSDYEGIDEFCYQICSTINPMYCSDTVVQIHVKQPSLDDLFPYNGISPNRDGINDIWKVKGIEKYPDNTVIIFNRWGDKLREFGNYNNTTHAWDGKNEKGEHLPDGTYFYILDVKDVGVLKGWIYLRGK